MWLTRPRDRRSTLAEINQIMPYFGYTLYVSQTKIVRAQFLHDVICMCLIAQRVFKGKEVFCGQPNKEAVIIRNS